MHLFEKTFEEKNLFHQKKKKMTSLDKQWLYSVGKSWNETMNDCIVSYFYKEENRIMKVIICFKVFLHYAFSEI